MLNPRNHRPPHLRDSGWARWLVLLLSAMVVVLAGAQQPRELLNSERIAAKFGNYGIEVLSQNDGLRLSDLFSVDGDTRTCRTFALVQYPAAVDPALAGPHAAILAGGSIGAVFEAQGWEVRKTHLEYGEIEASAFLADLMRIEEGTRLAEHVYVLDVAKAGRVIQYAALVEIHHPDYLRRSDLQDIYGAADSTSRRDLVAGLIATAAAYSR